ncbi:MAG: molybdopterin oxidoreductase family protein, partial [Actinomycetota bacterium]
RDELVRYQGVDINPVNWGWLCDRGRFNFESVNSADRLTTPLVKNAQGVLEPTSWAHAMDVAGRILRTAIASAPERVAILGGARGTNEDAFAWAALADAFGVFNRDAQLGDGLPSEVFGLPQATIDEASNATTIVMIAPDVKEELPVLYLRLRDAAAKKRSRIVEVTSRPTGLTPYAWKTIYAEPGKEAQALRDAGADLSSQLSSGSVVVVVGRANLAQSSDTVLAALTQALSMAPDARVLPALRRGNVRGALVAGLAPRGGKDAIGILEAAAAQAVDCLILVGSDPMADAVDADLARRALAGAHKVIAVDTFLTASSAQADVVFPAAAYGEKSGTTTNLEGRMSNVAQKITPAGTSRPDWMVAVELASSAGKDLGFGSLADVQQALVTTIAECAPASDARALRHDGVLMARTASGSLLTSSASAPDRNSYDFRAIVYRKLYDNAISTVKSPSLASLAPGASVTVHPLDRVRLGVEVGSKVKVTSSKASVLVALHESDDVVRGTAWLPVNQTGADVRELIDARAAVTDVKIEKV